MKRISVLFITILLVTLAGVAFGGQEGRLNVNTATVDELSFIPGISSEMARNIVQYRKSNGPLASLNELQKIKGFYPSSINELKCSLKLDGKSDFDLTDHRRNWCNKNNMD